MLSDEVLDKVIDRVTTRMEETNTYILEQIGKSINKIGNLTPTKAQQLVEILKYGGDYDKIVKKLADVTKLSIKDIYDIFEEVAKSDYRFAKQFYKYRKLKYIPYEKNYALQSQVNAMARLTVDNYVNLTKTLAFATKTPSGIVYTDIARTYQNTLDKAVLSIMQGKTTFQEEMYQVIKEFATSGIRTVDYASGRSYRLDSAVRMTMKTGLRTMHNEMQELIGNEFGADGKEISVHSFPAPDHEEAQGRQFSNEEFEKLNSGLDAEDYKGNIYTLDSDGKNGYRPISTMNCYHYTFDIVLGVSKPEYTDKQLKEIKEANQKGFELDGKHYTMYEGTQMQRRMETEMRLWKDIQIAGKASDNDTLVQQAQQHISQLTTKYKELSNTSGLPTKLERARVIDYRRSAKKYDLPIKLNSENSMLQNMVENSRLGLVVPKGAKLENVKVIAGYGTKTPIKTAKKLHKDYPDMPQIWQKKVATVEGTNIKYEIHYYENGNIQYYGKIKKGNIK